MYEESAEGYGDLLLRAGVAFAFLYPPIDALFDPYSWLGYFPHFVLEVTRALHIPDLLVLHGFGLVEVVIALWILFNKKIFWPSVAAVVVLLAIVTLDLQDFQIVFRDVAIAAAAASLAYTRWHASSRTRPH